MADPIDFKCEGCGRTLRVAAQVAGQKMKCPLCGKVQTVPTTVDEPEVVEGKPEDGCSKLQQNP